MEKINKDDESNINPLTPGNETINENIDIILSDLNSKINSLKAELNYYHEDLNEVKIQSKIYTNPFYFQDEKVYLRA